MPDASYQSGQPGRTAPLVSVVMPILNEERHLAEAVAAAFDQQYDGPLEVVLALGPSTDGTNEIAHQLAAGDARVHLVDNPGGRTADALNRAIKAATGDVVVRVDGHGLLDPDYVRTAVDTLESTGAANVGGIMDAEGTTPFERAVAAAMTSRLGVGAARFHTGGQAGPADTVYLGVFRRSWLDRVGGYDPHFVRAQDWEMNHRIRRAGGLVWFTPDLRVRYRPRATLKALSRQYFEYGRWRRVVSRAHRGTVNLRYLAAPVAVAGVVLGTVAGVAVTPWALVLPTGYVAIVFAGSATVGSGLGAAERVRLPLVLATMHMSWGIGFLTSPASLVPDQLRHNTSEH
ncbi:MAG: glycosyltransferase family 2 protein [Actinomycetales bacterium]